MPSFQELLSHAEKKLQAEPACTDYWNGCIRGLHRGRYGHDAGLDEELEWRVEESESCTQAAATATTRG